MAKAFSDELARVVFLDARPHRPPPLGATGPPLAGRDLLEDILRVRTRSPRTGSARSRSRTTLAEELAALPPLELPGRGRACLLPPERGTAYRAEAFEEALSAALAAAGVEGRVRAFHDLRHTAITNDAAAGANPIALMTKAGHANMKTTQTYLHLAGTVFRDEAERLEQRLLGAAAVESSTDLDERLEDRLLGAAEPVESSTDLG